MRDLTLNQQEQTRTQVLNSVLECQLSIAQAAEIVGFSQRHTKRILAAYRRDGPAALAHGNRGRRPHNAVPEAAATAVVKLATNNYAGANHTHLTELLREREGIDLSRPTVRRILAKAGMGSPRSRRSPQHRSRRRRMPREGPVRQWGIPWPCTATGIRPSSTMPARHRCLSNPPSSLRWCGRWASGRSSLSLPRPREGWNGWRQPSRTVWSPSCVWPASAPSTRPMTSFRSFCPASTPGSPSPQSSPREPTARCPPNCLSPRPSASSTPAGGPRQHGQIPMAGPPTAARDGPAQLCRSTGGCPGTGRRPTDDQLSRRDRRFSGIAPALVLVVGSDQSALPRLANPAPSPTIPQTTTSTMLSGHSWTLCSQPTRKRSAPKG